MGIQKNFVGVECLNCGYKLAEHRRNRCKLTIDGGCWECGSTNLKFKEACFAKDSDNERKKRAYRKKDNEYWKLKKNQTPIQTCKENEEIEHRPG